MSHASHRAFGAQLGKNQPGTMKNQNAGSQLTIMTEHGKIITFVTHRQLLLYINHCHHHQNAMNRKLCRKLVTGYFKVLQKQLSVQLGQTANGFALRRMEVICSKQ